MPRRIQFSSFFFACLPFTLACDEQLDTNNVQLEFSASVGEEPFSCDSTFDTLGGNAPADLRFYVSEIQLINAQGTGVPLQLDEGTDFQDAQFALIDFENGQGSCSGDSPTNQQVTGRLPEGDYSAIEFEVAVPSALNHSNPAEFPSLLQSPSMAWSWLLGFKYFKAEVVNEAGVLSVLHLGSTGCSREVKQETPHDSHDVELETVKEMHDEAHGDEAHGDEAHGDHPSSSEASSIDGHGHGHDHNHSENSPLMSLPTCSNPNRIKVRLEDFVLGSSTIHLDFAKVFSDLTLDDEQQCHGSASESSCATYFENVGLDLQSGTTIEGHELFTLR